MDRRVVRQVAEVLLGLTAPAVASAHSFSTPYIPPVPFWLYVFGAVATLILTFLAMFSRPKSRTDHELRSTPSRQLEPCRSPIMNAWLVLVLRAGAVFCLGLTIVAGLLGSQETSSNVSLPLFWVVFMLAFAFTTLIAGNLYEIANPWKCAASWLQRLGAIPQSPLLRYPRVFGYWPAFVAYAAFEWLELFGSRTPLTLAIALLIYSFTTFAGVAVFGSRDWFGNADFFGLFFRVIATLAPLEYQKPGTATAWTVRRRTPLLGALAIRSGKMSLVVFVLFMLSSTTYDAVHNTVSWEGLFWATAIRWASPNGQDLGRAQEILLPWYVGYQWAGMLLLPLLYFALYLLAMLWTKAATKTQLSALGLADAFLCSLIPIAVCYGISHNYAFFITAIRDFPRQALDPLGFGWSIFGTRIRYGSGAPQMNIVWHVEVAAVLAGHMVGIYLAHKTAARIFTTPRQLFFGELPLLVLLVGYTVLGLWILSLPLGVID